MRTLPTHFQFELYFWVLTPLKFGFAWIDHASLLLLYFCVNRSRELIIALFLYEYTTRAYYCSIFAWIYHKSSIVSCFITSALFLRVFITRALFLRVFITSELSLCAMSVCYQNICCHELIFAIFLHVTSQ